MGAISAACAKAPTGKPSTTCWGTALPVEPGRYWIRLGPQYVTIGKVSKQGAEWRVLYEGRDVAMNNKRFLAWCGPIREPLEA